MIREIYFFFRHGPKIQKRQRELGPVEFLKKLSRELDTDGLAEYRTRLVGDLEGDILEIGAGTGATFSYYNPGALAGPLMDLFNSVWLRVNKVDCNWNRRTVEEVRNAGFLIRSVEPYKIYSPAAPAVFPGRIIKADRPVQVLISNP